MRERVQQVQTQLQASHQKELEQVRTKFEEILAAKEKSLAELSEKVKVHIVIINEMEVPNSVQVH